MVLEGSLRHIIDFDWETFWDKHEQWEASIGSQRLGGVSKQLCDIVHVVTASASGSGSALVSTTLPAAQSAAACQLIDSAISEIAALNRPSSAPMGIASAATTATTAATTATAMTAMTSDLQNEAPLKPLDEAPSAHSDDRTAESLTAPLIDADVECDPKSEPA
jgi:hypothetical protein